MDEILNILIIEDDIRLCMELESKIANSQNYNLQGICNNTSDALNSIHLHPPHIIILDLELHNGSGSGIEILQELNNSSLIFMPFIIICTHNCSSYIHKLARDLGADYIFPKYQRDFSAEAVLDLLSILNDAIISKCNFTKGLFNGSSHEKKAFLQSLIASKLDCIGISRKHTGYNFLLMAIYISITQPKANYCQILAKEFNQKENSILQAMNRAIISTWKHQDIDILSTYYTATFNLHKGNPTPQEFVSYYRDVIRKELLV